MGRRRNIPVVLWLLLGGCGDVPLDVPANGTVQDPYDRVGDWYKGNFHMHTMQSDGSLNGAEVATLYRQEGYAVVSVTDHNMYGEQDGGISLLHQTDSLLHDWNGDGIVHPDHVRGSGVEAYVRDWTTARPAWTRDQWVQPARRSFLPGSLIMLPGVEVSHAYYGTHFVVVGVRPGPYLVPHAGFSFMEEVPRSGAFTFLAHPAEATAYFQDFARVVPIGAFHGIEIMNGLRLTKGEGADATALWDALLTNGYRLWGLANDDAHKRPGAVDAYPFTAFNMLLAESPGNSAFLAALHEGAFYASTGLLFEQLGVRDGALVVSAPRAQRIRFIGSGGKLLQDSMGAQATFEIGAASGYVRVEAVGDPARHGATWVEMAWSQPFFIDR